MSSASASASSIEVIVVEAEGEQGISLGFVLLEAGVCVVVMDEGVGAACTVPQKEEEQVDKESMFLVSFPILA